MNAEQQNNIKISLLWSVFKPILIAIVNHFGEDALEWITGKLSGLKDNGEVTTSEVDPHGCKQNQYWDETSQSCKLKIG